MAQSEILNRATIEPILREIISKLAADYRPEAVILYGSYAYGVPTRHSDIDLFIVRETEKGRIDRYVEAAQAIFARGRGIPVQPLVYTPDELQVRLDIGDPFVIEVLTKGELLYGRIRRPATTAVCVV